MPGDPAPVGPRLREAPGGLRFVLDRRPGCGVVAVQLWVAGGAAAERPGEEGACHLLEHLLVRDLAGSRGLTTADHLVLEAEGRPNEILPLARAWLAALDRRVSPGEEFDRERAVVGAEERVRRGRLGPGPADRALFPAHAYGRSVVGDAAGIESLRAEVVDGLRRRLAVRGRVFLVAVGDLADDGPPGTPTLPEAAPLPSPPPAAPRRSVGGPPGHSELAFRTPGTLEAGPGPVAALDLLAGLLHGREGLRASHWAGRLAGVFRVADAEGRDEETLLEVVRTAARADEARIARWMSARAALDAQSWEHPAERARDLGWWLCAYGTPGGLDAPPRPAPPDLLRAVEVLEGAPRCTVDPRGHAARSAGSGARVELRGPPVEAPATDPVPSPARPPGPGRVFVEPRPGTGRIGLALELAGGLLYDPPGRPGLSRALLARGRLQGREGLSSPQARLDHIARELGGEGRLRAGRDRIVLTFAVPTSSWPAARDRLGELLSDCAAGPVDLAPGGSGPPALDADLLAEARFLAHRYGPHPHDGPGRPPLPEPLDLDELRRHARASFVRGGARIALVGDLPEAPGADALLGALAPGEAPHPPALPAPTPRPGPSHAVAGGQARLWGFPVASLESEAERWAAALLLLWLAGADGPLLGPLRARLGLLYGLRLRHRVGPGPGHLAILATGDELPPGSMLEALTDALGRGPSAEEVERGAERLRVARALHDQPCAARAASLLDPPPRAPAGASDRLAVARHVLPAILPLDRMVVVRVGPPP